LAGLTADFNVRLMSDCEIHSKIGLKYHTNFDNFCFSNLRRDPPHCTYDVCLVVILWNCNHLRDVWCDVMSKWFRRGARQIPPTTDVDVNLFPFIKPSRVFSKINLGKRHIHRVSFASCSHDMPSHVTSQFKKFDLWVIRPRLLC
jgi:hypothetical protein